MIRHKRVPGLVREELHFPRLLTPIGWRSRRGGLLGTGKGNLDVNIFLLAIWTSPIIHLVSSPNYCIRIVFNLSWTAVIPRRNENTKGCVIFFFFWGGGRGDKQGVLWEMYKWRISNFIFKNVGMLKSETKLRLVGGLWSHCHGRLTLEPLREKLQWVQYRGHTVNSGDRSLARHQTLNSAIVLFTVNHFTYMQ